MKKYILIVIGLLIQWEQSYAQVQTNSQQNSLVFVLTHEEIKFNYSDSLVSGVLLRLDNQLVQNPQSMVLQIYAAGTDSLVYYQGINPDLLSATSQDENDRFRVYADYFEFAVTGLTPGSYLFKLLVFQEDGQVLVSEQIENY